MMAEDPKRLSDASAVGPTDRQTAKLDAARAISRRQQALLAAAGMEVPDRRWYLLRVAPRAEKAVDKSLEEVGVEHWLPMAKFEQKLRTDRKGEVPPPRIELAWPGYIFVKVFNSAYSWAGLSTVDGIIGVLGSAEYPIPISDKKINVYRYQLEHDEDVRKKLIDELQVGERVLIEFGCGHVTGIVQGVNEGDRINVEMLMFGSRRVFELPLARIIRDR